MRLETKTAGRVFEGQAGGRDKSGGGGGKARGKKKQKKKKYRRRPGKTSVLSVRRRLKDEKSPNLVFQREV